VKIVIVGGTGLIGSRVVSKLREQGHEAIPAAPSVGVNAVTGEGLAEALKGAAVVVDTSNAPDYDDAAVLKFFRTATGNLLAAEAAAGIGHHVVLSIVGVDRRTDSAYSRSKVAQEKLVESGPIPYSIVRATQFFEFIKGIAEAAKDGDTARVPPALIQPIAAADVATAMARIAVGPPFNGVIDIAGPEEFRLDDLVRRYLAARDDRRTVIADPDARYFGGKLAERTLVPDDNSASLGEMKFDDWLSSQFVSATR